MKLQNKQFKIHKDKMSIENIEALIKSSGLEPLRWSIIKVDNDDLIIYTTAF